MILVIVKLIGGLGNQMFQYATGRALAERLGVKLLLDVEAFKNYTKRSYKLHHFDLPAAIALPCQVHRATRPNKLAALVDNILGRRCIVYPEKAFTFDAKVLSLSSDVYLDGYWQSEKYFITSSNTIRREFALAKLGTSKDALWLDQIRGHLSVSLHVRRGDYISDANTSAVHGTCAPDYYARASYALAAQLGGDPHFFVFSDEPKWARENLRLQFSHSFASLEGEEEDRDIREFRLMCACKHHIIANSSFSWWAAWLGADPGKIVVAPKRWFRSLHDDRDLIPEGWWKM
jgi:Glycosyl transferase family 11